MTNQNNHYCWFIVKFFNTKYIIIKTFVLEIDKNLYLNNINECIFNGDYRERFLWIDVDKDVVVN